ncbi:MAG: Jag N-terminal domain-containing protein [Campylobacteraceae bacterium]|jgi:spoIIIJ-associated protein|nr:Jag N-terminal domain-containing protein [Campylobacteraceae bacterium]
MRVEANSLEEAYSKAAKELSCSVTELDLQVLQYPKSGFLGIGKKSAIVEVKRKNSGYNNTNTSHQKYEKNFQNKNRNERFNNRKKFDKFDKKERKIKDEISAPKQEALKQEVKKQEITQSVKPEVIPAAPAPTVKKSAPIHITTPFDDRFHKEKTDPKNVIYEVQESIKMLFSNLCFEVHDIDVSVYDEETLLIKLDGPDAALLIGKEGCRYKALSYLFYSWINIKYALGIRLEIAEFLKNQEEMIGHYLEPIIERIYAQGRGQTKILDGVLIKIALERLRSEFPEKYVGIKNGRDGGRFIVVNDFNRKNT